jgi:hypothetical protein
MAMLGDAAERLIQDRRIDEMACRLLPPFRVQDRIAPAVGVPLESVQGHAYHGSSPAPSGGRRAWVRSMNWLQSQYPQPGSSYV